MGTTGVDGMGARLADAVLAGDRAIAVQIATDSVRSGGATVPEIHSVLASVLKDIGNGWRSGGTTVWQEHIASSVARTVVEALTPIVAARAAERIGRTVLLACPQDESHELGLRMLADRFVLAGWDVVYLGADTPAREIAAAAKARSVEIVVLSASTHFHRVRLRAVLETLESTSPGVRVLVGGPALCGDGADEVGGRVFDPAEFFSDATGLVPTCEEE